MGFKVCLTIYVRTRNVLDGVTRRLVITMDVAEEAIDKVVTPEKSLSLSKGSESANAHCISSYGAYQAVCMLSPNGVREVFSDTPDSELLKIAEGVEASISDLPPEEHEGEVKDLAYKKQILLDLVRSREDNLEVTMNDEGRYKAPPEEEYP